MKTLLLLRHGEAGSSPDDRLRALTRNGRGNMERLGGVLVRRKLVPDAVLSSPALRAADSAESVVKGTGSRIAIVESEDLYLASAPTLLGAIQAAPESAETLLIVGHNPGLQDLAGGLAGAGQPDALAMLDLPLAAGGLIVIEFPGEVWRSVAPGRGTLKAVLSPPNYG